MPELSNGLFKVYTRIDGARFNAHLTMTPPASAKDRVPYRVLHVRKPTFIKAGDVIRTPGGEHIILMEQPDDFDWATTFRAAYAKDLLPWTRPVNVIDPVAHVQRDVAYISMGNLYVNFDTPEQLKLEGLTDTSYRFLTGQDVRVGDRVDNKVVKRLVETLGVLVGFAS